MGIGLKGTNQYLKYQIQTWENCWEFAWQFYSDHGIVMKKYWETGFHDQWKEVEVPKFLDAIFFSVDGRMEGHLGIYLNNNYFIHAARGGKVYIHRLGLWQKAIEGYYRWQF